MTDIALKRQAGELLESARKKRDDLKAFVLRQAEDKLEEGESRLTAEEIGRKHTEIVDLVNEAKNLERLDSLEDLFSRPDEHKSPEALRIQEILHSAIDAGGRTREGVSPAPFKSAIQFFRALRNQSPRRSAILPREPLDDAKRSYLIQSNMAAGAFDSGENVPTKFVTSGPQHEAALQEFKTLVGDDTGSAGRGDFLTPTENMAELLRAMGEQQVFANRARRVVMARRTVSFPRLAQTDATDTRPIYGFAAISKIAEGAQKDEREPTFEQLLITAIKYAAYVEASDELLLDSVVDVPPVLISLLTEGIGYEYDRDCIRGAGTTEPQGFLGHASEWTQNRKTVSTVTLEDVLGLSERFFGGDQAIWLLHPSVIAKLGLLAASNVIFWSRDVSTRQPGTLLGIPLVRTHKLPVVGTKGDLCLVDPMFYLAGDLQRLAVASSTHFKFRNDITAWRATFRAAGTPWPAGLFTMEAAASAPVYRVSPFCVLDDVATS